MKKQMDVYFTGLVQGVGFRFTVERIAKQFEVAGFVRNLPNGKVELRAEGDEKALQDFLAAVRQSPMQPYIQDVEITWKEPENNFQSFSIRA